MDIVYKPKKDYKVFVLCATYNHSKYIEDALNGFAIQKTTFPFVCLVMDDCSTDGEQDVIKAWMERECDMTQAEYIDHELTNVILVPHKVNKNCTFAFYLLKMNMYGKQEKRNLITPWREHCEYEAVCEGDDYWISDQHLQIKVEWLDKHQEYNSCFSNIKIHVETFGPLRVIHTAKEDMDLSIEDIIKRYTFIQLASIVIRVNTLFEFSKDIPAFFVGDYPLFVYCAYNGKVRMFKEAMTAYRVGVPGSHNTKNHNEKKHTDKLLRGLHNSHFMLESLNEYTDYKFDTLFKDRWYITLIQYYKETEQFQNMRIIYPKIQDKLHIMGLSWCIKYFGYIYFVSFFMLLKKQFIKKNVK